MTEIRTGREKSIARPLRILVPLIKKDLQGGNEAAERAGLPYYRAAGEKLLEAKAQISHARFTPWVQRNLKIKARQARYYMALAATAAAQNGNALPFSSLANSFGTTQSQGPTSMFLSMMSTGWQRIWRRQNAMLRPS